ncbi:hypothetical protein PHYSODRAFT_307859 [Phytophthora sojae]|uniref:Uncharacterized protein n=1 Tax=Phytophthora sojae (strain P6497) TaxID=1094619 RepID=G5AGJ3_PHYSP|nr:hypothetical protein PHYSODRAFT_307859 [Phytophthora sojae]EGZ05273.1 hypothetical protein PHYSODRAFT_307859 [Phytophthora sojae]|eukprot:XP_009539194.1 hypothetical protein PHYSODRAFT_307859 [Phytophthora sojae]
MTDLSGRLPIAAVLGGVGRSTLRMQCLQTNAGRVRGSKRAGGAGGGREQHILPHYLDLDLRVDTSSGRLPIAAVLGGVGRSTSYLDLRVDTSSGRLPIAAVLGGVGRSTSCMQCLQTNAGRVRGSNRAGGAGGGGEQHILPHCLDLDLRVDTSSGRLPIAAVLGGVGRSTSCMQCLQTNAGRVRDSNRAGGAGGGREQHILPHCLDLDLRVDTSSGRLPIAAVLGGVGRSTSCMQCLQTNAGRVRGSNRAGGAGGGGEQHILPHYLDLDLRVDTSSGRLPIAAVLGGVGHSTSCMQCLQTNAGRVRDSNRAGGAGGGREQHILPHCLDLDLRVDTSSGRLPIAAVLGGVGRSTSCMQCLQTNAGRVRGSNRAGGAGGGGEQHILPHCLDLDLRVDTSSGRLPIAAVLGGVGRSTSCMQCLQTNAGRVRDSNRAGGAGGGREQHILPHCLDLDLRVDTSSGRLPIAAVLGGVGRSTSCMQCLQTNAGRVRGSNRAGGAGGGGEQHILPHCLDLDLRVDTSSGRLPIAAVLGGVGRSTSCMQCLQTNAGRVRDSNRAGGAGGGREQHILPHCLDLDLRVDTSSGRLPIAAVLGGVGRSTSCMQCLQTNAGRVRGSNRAGGAGGGGEQHILPHCLDLDLRVDTSSGRLPIAAVLGGVGHSTSCMQCLQTNAGRVRDSNRAGGAGGGREQHILPHCLDLDLRVDTSSGRLPIAAVLGGVGRAYKLMPVACAARIVPEELAAAANNTFCHII